MADGGVRIDVGFNISKAEKDLAKLKGDIEKTQAELNTNESRKLEIEEQLARAGAKADEAKRKVIELKEELSQTRNRSERASLQSDLSDALEEQKNLVREVNQLSDEYDRVSGKIVKGTKDLGDMTAEADTLESTLAKERPLAAFSQGFDAAKKKLASFLKYALGIGSVIVLFNKMRSYIKSAISDFASIDPETKANIDGLKTSLETLKLSWGAAFAPVLSAVTPILQTLISWLVAAANAVNQFFSALMGRSTYKKATANMDAVASSAGGAADAVEEAKKQLMGFDEINRLEDTRGSGGGGGGGGGGGALGEVEEEAINPKIIALVGWLKDHLQEIALLAGTIGAILLAWKLSRWLELDFQKILGVIMIIYGAVLLVKGAIDAWQNGVDWENLRLMLGGIAIAAIGAGLAFGSIGAAIALLVGGVVLLVLGFKELVTQGELTDEAFAALALGIGLVGAAFALLTGNWIPLLIAALAVLVLYIVKHWDEIKEKTIEVWTAITDWLSQIWEATKEKTIRIFGPMVEGIITIWDGLKHFFQGLIDFIAGVFTGDWDRAWSGIANIFTGVAEIIGGAVSAIFGWFEGLIQACADALSWLSGVFDGINQLASRNADFNVQTGNLYATDPSQLRGYAAGGVVDRATALIAGENGKEAIVPLEQNTEWMSMVADGLMSRFMQSGFVNDMAAAFTSVPLPAMAGGGVVPPRSIGGGSAFSESDLDRIASAISGALSGSVSEDIKIGVYLDGRELSDAVTKWQKRSSRGMGI